MINPSNNEQLRALPAVDQLAALIVGDDGHRQVTLAEATSAARAALVRRRIFFDGSHVGLSEHVRLLPSSPSAEPHSSSLSSDANMACARLDPASALPRANMFCGMACAVNDAESLRGDSASDAIDMGDGSAIWMSIGDAI